MIINKVGKKTVVRYYSGILLSKKKKEKPTKFYSRMLQNGCQTVKRTGHMMPFNHKASKVQTN